MQGHYPAQRDAHAALAARGEMPSTLLMGGLEFQAFHLLDLAALAEAVRAHEARTGMRLSRLATLDHVDMLPLLLGREPIEGLTVSLDLTRGFPKARHARQVAALSRADGLLVPRCPVTPLRREIETMAAPALAGRQRIALTGCWDLFVRG
jgi:hypothetical protein